jgi:hypothetical protein
VIAILSEKNIGKTSRRESEGTHRNYQIVWDSQTKHSAENREVEEAVNTTAKYWTMRQNGTWSWVHREKLLVAELLKNFSKFFGILRLMVSTAFHLPVS